MAAGFMVVRVPDRSRTVEGGPVHVRTVKIHPTCPRCGRRRGRPLSRTARDSSSHAKFGYDWWENPCGHVDLYADVLKEADHLAKP